MGKQQHSLYRADTSTVMFGVFGDPIRQSKSPVMLNRAFEATGINAVYAAFHIVPGTLEAAVNGIRALQFRGVNVTIPHKVEVMRYLDRIDPAAEAIGAVNTIVNDRGVLTGFNTDGIGYVRSLKEEAGFDPKGKRVLVVGSGGAARGVAYALSREQPEFLWIANRTPEKANQLAALAGKNAECRGIEIAEIEHIKDTLDLIVNLTPAGMYPDQLDEISFNPEWISERTLISDTVYNPRRTRLLQEAEARGARVHEGLGMFVYQGAYAFEYWTGKPAPISAMKEAVESSS